jgi:hypothetical protein
VRCRACEMEKLYRSAEIHEFVGTPRRRMAGTRRLQRLGREALSRAANA